MNFFETYAFVMWKRFLPTLLIVAAIEVALFASSGELAYSQNGPFHAEIVGRDVLIHQKERSPLDGPARDEIDGILCSIETRTRDGHVLSKAGKNLSAEKAFRKSLLLFDELQKENSQEYSRHLIDKAELLEDFGRLLRKMKRGQEAAKYDQNAREIRHLMNKRPVNTRSYSNGYWNTLDLRHYSGGR